MYSVIDYQIEIELGLSEKIISKFTGAKQLLTASGAIEIGIIFIALILSGGRIYHFAQKQAHQNAPIPTLFKEALNK